MAKIDKEELEKLSPSERIKRLKAIEEEDTQEIEEAKKLIEETQGNLEKEGISESVKIPDIKPVNIESLFGLEESIREKPEPARESQLYQLAAAYQEAKSMAYSEEPLSEQQMQWVDQLGEQIEKVKYHSVANDIADLLVGVRTIVRKIKKYN